MEGTGLVGVIRSCLNLAVAPTGLCDQVRAGQYRAWLQFPLVGIEERAGDRTDATITITTVCIG